MQVLRKAERFIYESPVGKLIAAVAAVTLVKTGVWYIPNMGMSRQVAQNPFVNPFAADPEHHYLLWSWLGPYLTWLIGANGRWPFFLFHLFFSIAFTVLFLRLLFTRLPDREARTALILFAVLPVSATAYFWVNTDSLTLFLLTCALALPGRLPLAFGLGVALGMEHFEQAFVGCGGLILAMMLAKRFEVELAYRFRWAVALLAGIVCGKVGLTLLFHHYGVVVNSGRPYWLKTHLRSLLGQSFFHSQLIVWSALGVAWLVALKYLDEGRKCIPFFVALAGLMLVLPISADQTRVIAMVTFPLIAVFWLLHSPFLKSLSNEMISWVFVLWILVPWTWILGGLPKWSVFPYDVAWVLHQLFGWFSIPADQSIWPFF